MMRSLIFWSRISHVRAHSKYKSVFDAQLSRLDPTPFANTSRSMSVQFRPDRMGIDMRSAT